MKKIALSIVGIVAMVGVASAGLVPNGDFSAVGGGDWGGTFAGVGATPTFPATGGNTGGYATIDQTAGGWGGVMVSQVDATTGIDLATLGATAGAINTFSLDMINLGAGTPVAGMKVESWVGGGLQADSGDVTFAPTASWANYTFDWAVPVGATSIKFVPLLVVQPVGSSVGFDNVGVNVIPEPATLGLMGIFGGAMLFMRRRSRR